MCGFYEGTAALLHVCVYRCATAAVIKPASYEREAAGGVDPAVEEAGPVPFDAGGAAGGALYTVEKMEPRVLEDGVTTGGGGSPGDTERIF